MSTGRHAKKRAAETEERLAQEQEAYLAKEEKRKTTMEKDLESQRIATMRTRFGGQAPETTTDYGGESNTTTPGYPSSLSKFKSPRRLITSDPMKKTIMGMMIDNNQQGQ